MYCLIAALSFFLIKWILILYNIRFSQYQGQIMISYIFFWKILGPIIFLFCRREREVWLEREEEECHTQLSFLSHKLFHFWWGLHESIIMLIYLEITPKNMEIDVLLCFIIHNLVTSWTLIWGKKWWH